MIVKGVVVEIQDEYILVEVKRKSSCSGCSDSCSVCISGAEDTMRVRAMNANRAVCGDIVELEASDGTILSYAVALFILPLIIGLAMFFLPHMLFHNNLISYTVSGIAFFASVGIIGFAVNKKAAKRDNFIVK